MSKPVTPLLATDIIVCKGKMDRLPQVLLIERKNEPFGWALPGGFVEVGETTIKAACRELQEETGLIRNTTELHLTSVADQPNRDPRGHSVSIVYVTDAGTEIPVGADDAKNAQYFSILDLPKDIAFDHREIIGTWFLAVIHES